MSNDDQGTSPAEPQLSEQDRKRIVLEERLKQLSDPKVPARIGRIMRWSATLALLGTGAILIILQLQGTLKTDYPFALIPLGFLAYIGFAILLAAWARNFTRGKTEKELASLVSTRKAEELQDRLEENFFTNLVKINFKYLDQYYLQTQLQADKSFLLCAIAAGISLTVIIAGITMLFVQQSAKQAGYIATAAGTLGEFIAAVFFYLYNQTIVKMGEYHQKLVLTQNVSLALKISEELPAAEQVGARSKLIEYLSKDINFFLTARPVSADQPIPGRKVNRRARAI